MTLSNLSRVVLLATILLAAFGFVQHDSNSVSAQAKQKWEYRFIKLDGIERNAADTFEIKGLSRLGEDGWEAVGTNDSWVLLKRSR
jgi:hypothetical protein